MSQNLRWSLENLRIGGLVQDCSNSIANALELLPSCDKPSKWLCKLERVNANLCLWNMEACNMARVTVAMGNYKMHEKHDFDFINCADIWKYSSQYTVQIMKPLSLKCFYQIFWPYIQKYRKNYHKMVNVLMLFFEIILNELFNYLRGYFLYTCTSNIILAHTYMDWKRHKCNELSMTYLFSLNLFCPRTFMEAYLHDGYCDVSVLCHEQLKRYIDRNIAQLAIVQIGDALVLS